MKTLVVRSAFGDYRRGDEITDPQAVEGILAGGQAHYVTVTERDEPPAPIEPPAEAPVEKPKKPSK